MVCFDHSAIPASSKIAAGRRFIAAMVHAMESLDKVGDARSLAQVIVETGREPLFVLDEDLRVLAASDSFHKAFQITTSQTFHHPLFTMGDGACPVL